VRCQAVHNSYVIDIRPARREDLAAIVQLLARDSLLHPASQGDVSDEHVRAFDAIAAHPDNQIVVATMRGEVVATLQLTFIPGLSHQGGWRAQVEALRVREDLRNLGIGAQMMEWVIARARNRGCWLVQLTTNRARLDAHRFYERLGFTPSHVGMKLYL
jgi:GNAT superfamily N-acetyltransferase